MNGPERRAKASPEQSRKVPENGFVGGIGIFVHNGSELYLVEEQSKKNRGKLNIITETIKKDLGLALIAFWKSDWNHDREAYKRLLVGLLKAEVARALLEEYGPLRQGEVVSVAVELKPIVIPEPDPRDVTLLVRVHAQFESCSSTFAMSNHPETDWEVRPRGRKRISWKNNQILIDGEVPTPETFRSHSLRAFEHETPERFLEAQAAIAQAKTQGWDGGDYLCFDIRRNDQEEARLRRDLPNCKLPMPYSLPVSHVFLGK